MKYILTMILALCVSSAFAQQQPPSADELSGQLVMCLQQRDAGNGASISTGGKWAEQIVKLERENAKLRGELEALKKPAKEGAQ